MHRSMLAVLRSLLDWILGVQGGVIDVEFKNWNNNLCRVYIPDEQMWISIKDVLLLEEYEMLPSFSRRHLNLVLDAGAHVGLYSLKVAERAKKVIALEPDPQNYKLLVRNIHRSNATDKIIPLRAALWKDSGQVKLFKGRNTAAHSMFSSSGEAFVADSITLHDILFYYGEIDLMKIDIEGAEREVLLDASAKDLTRINKIVGELHPALYGWKGVVDILNRLKKVGFNVKLIKSPISQPYSYTIKKIKDSSLVNLSRLKLLVALSYSISKLLRMGNIQLPILYAWR